MISVNLTTISFKIEYINIIAYFAESTSKCKITKRV